MSTPKAKKPTAKQVQPEAESMEQHLQAQNEALKAELHKVQQTNVTLLEDYEQLAAMPMHIPQVAKGPAVPLIPTETFEVEGQAYQFAVAKIKVRNVGERTALEAIVDDEQHTALGGLTICEWLVANNSTSIKKA